MSWCELLKNSMFKIFMYEELLEMVENTSRTRLVRISFSKRNNLIKFVEYNKTQSVNKIKSVDTEFDKFSVKFIFENFINRFSY